MPTFTFDPNTGQTVVKDTRTEAQKKADEQAAQQRKSERYSIAVNEGLDKALDSGSKSEIEKAKKRYANWQWYQKNKEKKKKYNEQYYKDNIEYWRSWYKYHRDDQKFRQGIANSTGTDVSMRQKVQNAKWARESAARSEADLANLKKAEREYSNYLESKKKLPFKEAWSQGAQMLRDAGSSFINKLLRK